jgi:hypothetical protein
MLINFSNLKEEVRKHIVLILIIVGLSLFLGFIIWWSGILNHYEGLDGQVMKPTDLAGKDVYLKHTFIVKKTVNGNEVQTYDISYLAVSPVKSCNNYKASYQECDTAMAILQKQKNSFAKFRVLLENNEYSLFSLHDLSQHLMLNQSLPYTGRSAYGCFEHGSGELIKFVMEPNNSGKMRLKFTKTSGNTIINYYLGICDDTYNCTQGTTIYPRLCFYTDVAKAAHFDFEVAPTVIPDTKNAKSPLIMDTLSASEESVEGFESDVNHSLQDMISWDNITLASNDSIRTIEGLDRCSIGLDTFYPV